MKRQLGGGSVESVDCRATAPLGPTKSDERWLESQPASPPASSEPGGTRVGECRVTIMRGDDGMRIVCAGLPSPIARPLGAVFEVIAERQPLGRQDETIRRFEARLGQPDPLHGAAARLDHGVGSGQDLGRVSESHPVFQRLLRRLFP
jgi:hypothetical protein